MSGSQQAVFMNQRSFGPPPPTVIGQAYEGGFWAGDIGVSGIATHHLVVGPLSTAQTQLQFKTPNTAFSGAFSVINGPQNTADMIAAGNSTVFPCAHFCNDAVIGGFSDWYMPSRNEQEVCYFNLKPGTQANGTSSGKNPNAVPARASNYTNSPSVPSQTSVAAFQTGGAEPFNAAPYWSSTQDGGTFARAQSFDSGSQFFDQFFVSYRVRAVRRVPV